MKVECPRCQQSLELPPEWAGKHVRCRGCNYVFQIPRPGLSPEEIAREALPPNLADLAQVEQAQVRPEDDGFELQDFEGAPPTVAVEATTPDEKAAGKQGEEQFTRICPECRKPMSTGDEYTEVFCSHCGAVVPGPKTGSAERVANDTRFALRLSQRALTPGGFYEGFLTAFIYPIPAITTIAAGMGIAFCAIFLPIGTLYGLAVGAALNPLTEAADVSWVRPLLSGLFLAEAIYFGGVGYFALIDTIRHTATGIEKPPTMIWNITSVATALAGYAGLAAYYMLISLVFVLVANSGTLHIPTTAEDFEVYRTPKYFAALAIVTFTVPMNIIGLSSGRLREGFNPYRILRSIAQTGTHYIFLFLIVCIYLMVYLGILGWAIGWASDKVLYAIESYAKEGPQEFAAVVLGLVAWAVLIAVGFYFAYVMGRVLGLFTKSYKKLLEFDI